MKRLLRLAEDNVRSYNNVRPTQSLWQLNEENRIRTESIRIDSQRNFFLVGAFVLAVIFEGAVGKWISPSLEYVAIGTRELLAVAIIARAVINGKLAEFPRATQFLALWTLIVMVWGLLQNFVNEAYPLATLIGYRFWVMYLWVALAMCSLLTSQQFGQLCNLMIVVGTFMVPLVLVQHFSAPDSFINKASAEEALIFRVYGDIVRTTGTFSFTLGYTCFLAMVLPLAFSTDRIGPVTGTRARMLVLLAVGLSVTVSGSRAMIAFAVVLFIVSVACDFCTPKPRAKIVAIASVAAAISVAFLIPIFLPEISGALLERFVGASEVEDANYRLFEIFVGNPLSTDQVSFWGQGIGLTANMTGQLVSGERGFLVGEGEPERLLLGGGLLGVMWIAGKIVICASGLWWGLRRFLQTWDKRALLLWVACTYGLIGWPVSGQLSAHALGHILLAAALMSVGFTASDKEKYLYTEPNWIGQ